MSWRMAKRAGYAGRATLTGWPSCSDGRPLNQWRQLASPKKGAVGSPYASGVAGWCRLPDALPRLLRP